MASNLLAMASKVKEECKKGNTLHRLDSASVRVSIEPCNCKYAQEGPCLDNRSWLVSAPNQEDLT